MPFNRRPDGTHMTGEEVFDNLWGKDVPAWSLAKLINMMPDQIEYEGYNYYLFILPRDKEFTIKYSAGSNLAQSYCRENLFDAIAEMSNGLSRKDTLTIETKKSPKLQDNGLVSFLGQGR